MDIVIKHWLMHSGRSLEQARHAYWFENGHKVEVINALKHYQNPDGGFGHGLEPDFINPNSNPIDCWMACNILEELNVESSHDIIQRLLGYLKRTPYKENWQYYFRIPTNNDYPHAPWWHYEMDNALEGHNPTASLLGFLYKHLPKDDPHYDSILDVIHKAKHYFMVTDITEMHELRCFNELYLYVKGQMNNHDFRIRLAKQNLKALEKDSKKWVTTYCTRPLQLFISPSTPGAKEAESLIQKEIELMMKNRNQEGVFDVNWSWGQFEETFIIAQRQWMGIIAFETLKSATLFKINIKL